MRSEHDIIVDLEKLSQEEGFVYTFSTLAFTSLWAAPEEYSEIDWTRRPNHQELAFLLGLMAKHPMPMAQAHREWVLPVPGNPKQDADIGIHKSALG